MKWEPENAGADYGTFMPGLVWAVENTQGPILELGGGYHSTPYLAGLPRQLWTHEHDIDWLLVLKQQFTHPIVAEFESLPKKGWSVVLVDGYGWTRQEQFDALDAEVFVIHDTQDPWITEESMNKFAYRYDFGDVPRTTLLSNTMDVARCSP